MKVDLKDSTIVLTKQALLDKANEYRDLRENLTIGEDDEWKNKHELYVKAEQRYREAYNEVDEAANRSTAEENKKTFKRNKPGDGWLQNPYA